MTKTTAIAAIVLASFASSFTASAHEPSAPSFRQVARKGHKGKKHHAVAEVLSERSGWTCINRSLEQGSGEVRDCSPTPSDEAIEANEEASYR